MSLARNARGGNMGGARRILCPAASSSPPLRLLIRSESVDTSNERDNELPLAGFSINSVLELTRVSDFLSETECATNYLSPVYPSIHLAAWSGSSFLVDAGALPPHPLRPTRSTVRTRNFCLFNY